MNRKIILFGGTFDPVHNGHILVAESALKQIGAEKVVFIPARRSPHKETFPYANAQARFEMLCLAIADEKKFRVSDCELKRAQPSYTLDTVKDFLIQYGPRSQIYWLLGADMVADLPRWYHAEELIDLCNLTVMSRPGCGRGNFEGLAETLGIKRIDKLRRNVVKTPLVDISSTEIRQKLGSGEEISGLVHPNVLKYIKENNLYSL